MKEEWTADDAERCQDLPTEQVQGWNINLVAMIHLRKYCPTQPYFYERANKSCLPLLRRTNQICGIYKNVWTTVK